MIYRNKFKYIFFSVALLMIVEFCHIPLCAYAQDKGGSINSGNAAYLFAYYPKEGKRTDFEEGYRRHLDWHSQKNDQLVWYAWYVIFGERLGFFIDGTFGITIKAFDERVDQKGDRADFAKTTAPFSDPVFRNNYRLRAELSTGYLLEDWKSITHDSSVSLCS